MTYEIRVIERVVKVYRVEAEEAWEADEKHGYGQSELVDSFPIEGEQFTQKVQP